MGTFLLGITEPSWLRRPGAPAMLSLHRLARYARPVAGVARPWVLDSGAYTHLAAHGRWTLAPQAYVDTVRRWAATSGALQWAATQDWLCAPPVLAATGLTIAEHQARTVESWHVLRQLAPEVRWVPTLQGWEPEQYLAHAAMYGAELAGEPLVGVGSIAPRQHTPEAHAVVQACATLGLPLHGWGVKRRGLRLYGHLLASADATGWSLEARRDATLSCGPERSHPDCRNCWRWAEAWAVACQADMDAPPAQ
jgi:hypothetical protein